MMEEKVTIFGRSFSGRQVLLLLFVGPFVLWLAWGTLGIRAMVAVHSWLGGPLATPPDRFTAMGQTGDLFGGVNALFAAYAFVGVAVAAFWQYRTFKVVELQQKQQGFEPLFFQLITLNRQLLKQVQSLDGLTGSLMNALNESAWKADVPDMPKDKLIEHVSDLYYDTYNAHEEQLGPYYRSLYHVFKLIDSSGLTKVQRVEYADVARAMLSRDELKLMVVNCSSHHGTDFRRLISKYGVLKHLPTNGKKYEGLRNLAISSFGATALQDADKREAHWNEHPTERPADMH